MPAFKFKLASVLRYRQGRRDLCAQLLAQVLADDRVLLNEREGLERQRQAQLEELRAMGLAGRISVEGATARRYYLGQLAGDIRVVDHRRGIVAGQVELCRKALAQAEKDVKVLEKLEDKQAALARDEQRRREGRELEETWQAIHLREVAR
jgi:flagellar export protein FliJ